MKLDRSISTAHNDRFDLTLEPTISDDVNYVVASSKEEIFMERRCVLFHALKFAENVSLARATVDPCRPKHSSFQA